MDDRIYNYINKWKQAKNVVGILVCGSYATNLNKPDSDVDIRIIYSEEEVNYRKKGVETFEGLVFSYLTGTIKHYLNTLHNQFFRQSKFEARMFGLGVILFDTNDTLKRLSEKARSLLDIVYEPPREDLILLKRYMLFNNYSAFLKLDSNARLYTYNYFQFLDHIFKAYSFFIGFEAPSVEKLNRVLFDKTYSKVNYFSVFPDATFLKFWEEATNSEPKDFSNHAKLLYTYLDDKMEIFDPNNFEATI